MRMRASSWSLLWKLLSSRDFHEKKKQRARLSKTEHSKQSTVTSHLYDFCNRMIKAREGTKAESARKRAREERSRHEKKAWGKNEENTAGFPGASGESRPWNRSGKRNWVIEKQTTNIFRRSTHRAATASRASFLRAHRGACGKMTMHRWPRARYALHAATLSAGILLHAPCIGSRNDPHWYSAIAPGAWPIVVFIWAFTPQKNGKAS